MSKIKFGILGFGHIGKKHAAMAAGHPDAVLTAIADTDVEKQQQAKELYPNTKVFSSIDELLENTDTDIINICTPNGWHARNAITALEAKKHVVVEKPMGLNRAECEEVIFKSLQVSKNVFIVKQNRYSPTSVWLKSLIDENRLGKIYMV